MCAPRRALFNPSRDRRHLLDAESIAVGRHAFIGIDAGHARVQLAAQRIHRNHRDVSTLERTSHARMIRKI